jgi:hypothetical protein
MKDPQFFSLEGVDIHDDAALEAFVHHVWERFMQANPRPQGLQGPLENHSNPRWKRRQPRSPRITPI